MVGKRKLRVDEHLQQKLKSAWQAVVVPLKLQEWTCGDLCGIHKRVGKLFAKSKRIEMSSLFVQKATEDELNHGIKWMLGWGLQVTEAKSCESKDIDARAVALGCDLKVLKDVQWQNIKWTKYCSKGCGSWPLHKKPDVEKYNKDIRWHGKCGYRMYVRRVDEAPKPAELVTEQLLQMNRAAPPIAFPNIDQDVQDQDEEEGGAGPGEGDEKDEKEEERAKKRRRQEIELFGSDDDEVLTEVKRLQSILSSVTENAKLGHVGSRTALYSALLDMRPLALDVKILEKTQIGIQVNHVRKLFDAGSEISSVAGALVQKWKALL